MRELRKVEEQMKQVKGGVTAAKGFEAASTAAGIKYKDRTDMALVYSQVPVSYTHLDVYKRQIFEYINGKLKGD